MKKQLLSFVLTTVFLVSSQHAIADVIQDYKCTTGAGNRGPKTIISAGLGVANGATSDDYTSKSISFCDIENNCWASKNYIDSPEGKADYATLLTAVASGSKITFYCEPNDYARYIRLYRAN
ncbi:hypothetical protein [Enterobacter bugandensis]|uniref:hypothetical protein n=1 Tax=Enterobacter bugandensis TaxID=881260 RepID=UPI0023602105|nr:hypothetical protein [Enterobacter bugandensis]